MILVPLAAAVLASGCAAAVPGATPAPVSAPGAASASAAAPATSTTAAPPAPRPEAPDRAPAAWHRLAYEESAVYGTGVDRAVRELLADRAPRRRVIVAVIDGGVDTLHPQLRPILWRNAGEVAGNGVDDDGNGYVDDVRGWSTVPSVPGDSSRWDTFEITRLYAACGGHAAGGDLARPDGAACDAYAAKYREKAAEVRQMSGQVTMIGTMMTRATATLRGALGAEALTGEAVRAYTPKNEAESGAKRIFLQLEGMGIDSATLAQVEEQLTAQRIGLDTLFDPRRRTHGAIGNPDVMGEAPRHGTHVAGIIGAVAEANGTMRGLAPLVTILPVRAVPEGDERDPEVARAIRYAVDNGAQVINMSFGKGYSPGKAAVDSAVRYAAQQGVLLVHAAGNDGANNDEVPSFPSRRFDDGAEMPLWLEVGASSWKAGAELPAEFTNYGKRNVDLFAPGVDITSTVPGGGVDAESGTSMAAPVVSGIAALLLSYFPELEPAQVRRILVETARTVGSLEVNRPGDEPASVRFSELSRTGGLVDAYAAVQRALELTRTLP